MKDLYIEEFDRIVGEYLDAGESEAAAEALAAREAYDAMTDRLADMADRARDAAKYEGF